MMRLATKDTPLLMTEKDAIQCFGLSKMTVKNELDKSGELRYNTLKKVEFYEYVSRLASIKFAQNYTMPLSKKIENALDLILPAYGMTRNPVGEIEELEAESSDDSINYDEVDTTKKLILDP